MNEARKLPRGWGVVRTDDQPKPTAKAKPRRRRTLRRAFIKFQQPRMRAEGAKKAALSPYLTALKAWETYWCERYLSRRINSSDLTNGGASVPQTDSQKSQGKTKVYDPPIDRITKAHLESFRQWLMPGRTAITVNNYLRSIGTILRSADTWLDGQKEPKVKRLKARKAARKIVISIDHVDTIYRSCESATWPSQNRSGQPIDPAEQWRAAVVLFFCFGFRTQEVVRYQSWRRSLSWENFHWQSASPGLSDAVNDHGWLCYVPEKQEGVKPEPLVLALPELVALHLRALWSNQGRPESGIVFDWPWNERSFRSTWRAICRAGGVKPKLGSGVPRYTIKHFRKTATTYHNLAEPGIAPYIVGHADRESVSDRHYNNPELATTRALQKFPLPKSFDLIRNTNQLRLF